MVLFGVDLSDGFPHSFDDQFIVFVNFGNEFFLIFSFLFLYAIYCNFFQVISLLMHGSAQTYKIILIYLYWGVIAFIGYLLVFEVWVGVLSKKWGMFVFGFGEFWLAIGCIEEDGMQGEIIVGVEMLGGDFVEWVVGWVLGLGFGIWLFGHYCLLIIIFDMRLFYISIIIKQNHQ